MNLGTLDLLNDVIVGALVVLFLPVWLFAVFVSIKRRRTGDRRSDRFATLGALGVLSLGGASALISTSIRSATLDETLAFLKGARAAHLTIEGRPIANSGEILAALTTLAPLEAHHSSHGPLMRFVITATNGTLVLLVGRDGHNHREYWVFHPAYRATRTNEIGRIKTAALDAF